MHFWKSIICVLLTSPLLAEEPSAPLSVSATSADAQYAEGEFGTFDSVCMVPGRKWIAFCVTHPDSKTISIGALHIANGTASGNVRYMPFSKIPRGRAWPGVVNLLPLGTHCVGIRMLEEKTTPTSSDLLWEWNLERGQVRRVGPCNDAFAAVSRSLNIEESRWSWHEPSERFQAGTLGLRDVSSGRCASYRLRPPTQGMVMLDELTFSPVDSPCAVAVCEPYATDDGPRVSCIDARAKGGIRWTLQSGDLSSCFPEDEPLLEMGFVQPGRALSNRLMLFAYTVKQGYLVPYLVSVDAQTGEVAKPVPFGRFVCPLDLPIVSDDHHTVVLTDLDYTEDTQLSIIEVFDVKSGLFRFTLAYATSLEYRPVGFMSQHVAILYQPFTISCIDTSTGKLQKLLQLPYD